MSSVTLTGICFCPLWTPKVSPTNWGRIVDRLLQMRMISLRPELRTPSAFFNKYPSTNGPFETERAPCCSLLRAVPGADDEPVRRLVLACLVTLGRLAPRGCPVLAALGAAAVWMIDGVHGDRAHR